MDLFDLAKHLLVAARVAEAGSRIPPRR